WWSYSSRTRNWANLPRAGHTRCKSSTSGPWPKSSSMKRNASWPNWENTGSRPCSPNLGTLRQRPSTSIWRSRPGALSKGEEVAGQSQGGQGRKCFMARGRSPAGRAMFGKTGQFNRGILAPKPSIGVLLGEQFNAQPHRGPAQNGGQQVPVVPTVGTLSRIHGLLGQPGQGAAGQGPHKGPGAAALGELFRGPGPGKAKEVAPHKMKGLVPFRLCLARGR